MFHTRSILHDFAINHSAYISMSYVKMCALLRFSYPGEGNIQIITGLLQRILLMNRVQCHEFLQDHLMTTFIRCQNTLW